MKRYAIITQLLTVTAIASALSIEPDPFTHRILPPMAFTNASISDVASTLERAYTTDHCSGYPSSINFIIHPSCSNVVVNTHFAPTSTSCTLNLLRIIYGIEYTRISDHILLAQQGEAPMTYRMYDVLPTVFENCDLGGTDVCSFFSQFGISFPENASATYLVDTGKLIVHNSTRNLDVLEKVLSVLNVIPYQVETTVEIIRPTDSTLAAKVRDTATPDHIESLLQTAETLFSSTAVTLTGRTSTNAIESKTTNAKTSSPIQFGNISVRPSVSPEGQLITISLLATLNISTGNEQTSYTLDTSLMLYNGARMLLWFSTTDGHKGAVSPLCLIIKTRLIDPAGLPPDNSIDIDIIERISGQY